MPLSQPPPTSDTIATGTFTDRAFVSTASRFAPVSRLLSSSSVTYTISRGWWSSAPRAAM
ncbi:hypothetical protein N7U49_24330 [Streptomyces sp. AD2-2]|nr:hypothetical protein N7U49_24330 [Streptomyces sp. AD2-2]